MLEDGGNIAIDWAQHNDYSSRLKADSPIVVVCHGLTGCSKSMRRFCSRALKDGYRPVVFNKRGHGGTVLTTPKLQPFGDISDLKCAIAEIEKQFPYSSLYGVGFSAGSGLLVSYLGETGDKSRLKVGVSISPGYDALKLFCDGGVLPIYNFLMTFSLKNFLKQHINVLSTHIDVHSAMKARSISEFDKHVYCKLSGNLSNEAYWKFNNPMRDINNIVVPILCINALDDPVCTQGMIDYDIFTTRDAAILATTDKGSHCGFFEGLFKTHSWCDTAAVDFLNGYEKYVETKGSHPRFRSLN